MSVSFTRWLSTACPNLIFPIDHPTSHSGPWPQCRENHEEEDVDDDGGVWRDDDEDQLYATSLGYLKEQEEFDDTPKERIRSHPCISQTHLTILERRGMYEHEEMIRVVATMPPIL